MTTDEQAPASPAPAAAPASPAAAQTPTPPPSWMQGAPSSAEESHLAPQVPPPIATALTRNGSRSRLSSHSLPFPATTRERVFEEPKLLSTLLNFIKLLAASILTLAGLRRGPYPRLST